MNAVEIEEAITALAEQPFDGGEFPFAFLEAFGNKETTIKRLRAGASNKSDLGGVLQTNNIHIATCCAGRGHEDARRAEGEPGHRQGEGEVHPRDRRRGLRGRGPGQRRNGRLRLSRTFPTTSASSCRWPASPPSSRSAKAPSTSGRPAA